MILQQATERYALYHFVAQAGRWAGVDSAWEQEKPEASLSCRLAPACSRHERWRTVQGKMLACTCRPCKLMFV
ncbi:MAG: hypothetical protein U1B80_05525 [Anaerolineaceae bacterium]|nr:hypothetical protein [Anaerolineaceae bacterium]